MARRDVDSEMVLGIYADLFNCMDQQAADQLRNRVGLEAALARPAWMIDLAEGMTAEQLASRIRATLVER